MSIDERYEQETARLRESATGQEAQRRQSIVNLGAWELLRRVPYTADELAAQQAAFAPAVVEQAPSFFDQVAADNMAHQARRDLRNADVPAQERIDLSAADDRTFDQLVEANPDVAASMDDIAFGHMASANQDVAEAMRNVSEAFQGQPVADVQQWQEHSNA